MPEEMTIKVVIKERHSPRMVVFVPTLYLTEEDQINLVSQPRSICLN
jgi:hypothetical protein